MFALAGFLQLKCLPVNYQKSSGYNFYLLTSWSFKMSTDQWRPKYFNKIQNY